MPAAVPGSSARIHAKFILAATSQMSLATLTLAALLSSHCVLTEYIVECSGLSTILGVWPLDYEITTSYMNPFAFSIDRWQASSSLRVIRKVLCILIQNAGIAPFRIAIEEDYMLEVRLAKRERRAW